MDEEKVLTLAEASAFLKISTRQVVRYRIPCASPGHKTKLFLKSDLLAWLREQRDFARRGQPKPDGGN
jgi:hypothetical protein